MTKAKLAKNLKQINYFKIVSVSKENYLSYQLLSPYSPLSSSS